MCCTQASPELRPPCGHAFALWTDTVARETTRDSHICFQHVLQLPMLNPVPHLCQALFGDVIHNVPDQSEYDILTPVTRVRLFDSDTGGEIDSSFEIELNTAMLPPRGGALCKRDR